MKKTSLCICAKAVAALAAVSLVVDAPAETYYLTTSKVKPTALADPQYWKTAGGTVCSAFSRADDFVAKDKLAYLRPAQSETGYFLGGSFAIGEGGSPGAASLYLADNASIGFADHGEVADGGLIFHCGVLDHGDAAGKSGTVVGRISVTAPASAPFRMRYGKASYVLKLAASLHGAAGTAFEFGSSLAKAVSSAPVGTSAKNITLELSGDCSGFAGCLTMTGVVDQAVVSASGSVDEYASKLVLSNSTFAGAVVLNGGCVLSAAGPSNVCTVGTLTMRSGSVLHVPGCVERNSGTGVPTAGTNAFFVVTDALNVNGPVRLVLPGCEPLPDGTTNRIALLSAPAGANLDPGDFTVAGGALPPVPYRLRVEPADQGRKILVCEIDPYVVMIESDSSNYGYGNLLRSSLTNAASWSNGMLPDNKDICYLVAQHPKTGSSMWLRTLGDGLRSTYDYTFAGRRLIIGSGCGLMSHCAAFRSSNLPLLFTDGAMLGFVNFQNTLFAGGVEVGDGTFSIRPYAGNKMEVDRLYGSGTIKAGTLNVGTDSIAGYYLFHDTSEFFGKIDLQTTKASAIDLSLRRCQHLHVSGNTLGGALDTFVPDALRIADSSAVYVDESCPTQTLANTVNRGIKIDGVGRFLMNHEYDRLRVDWPVTYNGVLRKEGEGTLVLGGSALFGDASAAAPVADGTADVMLAGGTLAIASAGAVDGCSLVVSNGTHLVVSYASDKADLLVHGLRNAKTTTPFVLEGIDKLPLAVDFSEWGGLPPERLTVGLLTVTNDAATLESVRSMLPDRIEVSNFGAGGSVKATLTEPPGTETGLVTFRLTVRHVGTSIILR